jgi:hypothetical protein
MRRLMMWVALAGLCPHGVARADGQAFTISTGYNETALAAGFNRGTVLQSEFNRGRLLYFGSVDSRGLASVGFGGIAAGQNPYYRTIRYPVITVFARHGEGSGVALDLHQDWYPRGDPTRTPGKFLTLFQTKGGIVWQQGELSRVRVTQGFVTSERTQPGRSQGVEWVIDFRQDYPANLAVAGERGAMTALVRRSMRHEQWVFFSRELGVGVLRLNVGATYKTVFKPIESNGSAQPAELLRLSNAGRSQVLVLMARIGYTIRRW